MKLAESDSCHVYPTCVWQLLSALALLKFGSTEYLLLWWLLFRQNPFYRGQNDGAVELLFITLIHVSV